MTEEAIDNLLEFYKKEQKKFIKSITDIMWHMRSLGREEAWSLSPDERTAIEKLIDEHIKLVEKTKLPLL